MVTYRRLQRDREWEAAGSSLNPEMGGWEEFQPALLLSAKHLSHSVFPDSLFCLSFLLASSLSRDPCPHPLFSVPLALCQQRMVEHSPMNWQDLPCLPTLLVKWSHPELNPKPLSEKRFLVNGARKDVCSRAAANWRRPFRARWG